MLRNDVLYMPLQLRLMGFNPCSDGDLMLNIAYGYGEGYIVLTFVEDETNHIFEKHKEGYLHIQVI